MALGFVVEPTNENRRARFFAKVKLAPSGCLEWQGALQSRGYGALSVDGRTVLAHRYAWELERGPIPGDLTVDHLCRNRKCVNAQHLELVTLEENSARVRRGAVVCRRGHDIAKSCQENGQRRCGVCRELRRAREAFERACARRGIQPAKLATIEEYRAALASLKASHVLPRRRSDGTIALNACEVLP